MHEHEVSGRPVQGRRAGVRRQSPRRRASGPRPVRPAVKAVAVRPAEVERPHVPRSGAGRVPLPVPGMRMLARPRAVPPAAAALAGVRRALAGLAATVVAGAVVVGLGLLADAAAAARAGEEVGGASEQPAVVTVHAERTPWDVARRVAPGASGSDLAALAERIVTDNSLTSVSLHPGQVLRVTFG